VKGKGVVEEAPALAVTTRARRGDAPLEVGIGEQGNYSSDEEINLSELDRVARRATKDVERENIILQDRERTNAVHDLDNSDVGEWEGPGVPVDEFDVVGNSKVERSTGYDLWADLSTLKADITFGQLLEISPTARKTLKEGMPVHKRMRKVKAKIAARIQSQGGRDVKAIEIEVVIVDKVVPNVLVDGGSSLNILPEDTMKKLGLGLTGPSPLVINMANQSSTTPLGMIKDCRMTTGGEEYLVTFHVIKMHSNKDTFPILLGRPWLRMANAMVNWGGPKPSITYGPEGNRVIVSIGSLEGWMKKEMYLPLEKEIDDLNENEIGKALVGVVHPEGQRVVIDSGSGSLGPNFYNYGDNGDYSQWLREYPESEVDVMVTFHQVGLGSEFPSVSLGEGSLLEPCEVLTEEEWVSGGLTPWVDDVEEGEVSLIHVDGTQEEDVIIESSKLEEPLHFKTTSTGIVVGQDVKDYPNVPSDWYRNKEEQAHVSEADWRYVDVKLKNGKTRQMKMGSKLGEKEVREYSNLVDEFSDTFAWSYDELKGIPREMVEHRIPLIPGARPIRQKERRMHLQADHLSRLSEEIGKNPVNDMLIDDSLFVVTSTPEWYAGIVEFLTTHKLPKEWTKEERRKVRVNSRQFVVVGHRLFRRGSDGILRRCVSKTEVEAILIACHDSACGGHFSGQLTGQKILRAGYFWPTLFKDAHDYVRKCDACQRYARNDLRMEMPLHVSLPLIPFEKWGIDYVGEVHPQSSKGMKYIVVATEYLTKWAEAKAVKTDTAEHAATFMYENIISRFGVPKILVSDRGTHFLNDLIREMTEKFKIDHRKTTPYHPQTNGQTERVNGILVSILRKTVIDSKRDWDTKLTAALWAYRTTYKVTTRATPFSLVYGLEATLPIEYEVESLRVAVSTRLTESQSLRNRLTDLEALDEGRRMAAQHIEAIQRRRKITFDKRHKRRALTPGMMVMIQDARKLEFPAKFNAVWLGPYLVYEVFPNNSIQLETLNGELFPTRTSGSRCKEYRA